MTSCGRSRGRRLHSRGQALLILVAMLSVAAVLLVYGSSTEASRRVTAENRTQIALEEARQALIGRALADANRPGSLPCPDGDDDGSADFFVGSACASYVGRLPWRTLGIGALRDEAGERLWYVLAPAWRDHSAAPAINADSRGALVVWSQHDERVITTEAVAIVFAPGSAVGPQARDSASVPCPSASRNTPRNRCASNYLDSAGKANNAAPAGPFIMAGASTEAFNDRLAVIVTADFMPLLERRIALEARDALLAYRSRSACRCFPWADSAHDGASDIGTSRGRLPVADPRPEPWPTGALPRYLRDNGWTRSIHYAVGRLAFESAGAACTTCTADTLSLDGASGLDALLITTGYAENNRTLAWTDHLDDAANRDGNDAYVAPASRAASRDHAYTVVGAASACSVAARVLVDHLPCTHPVLGITPMCQAAGARLGTCGCAAGAATLLKAPCVGAPGNRTCEAALRDVQTCGG